MFARERCDSAASATPGPTLPAQSEVRKVLLRGVKFHVF